MNIKSSNNWTQALFWLFIVAIGLYIKPAHWDLPKSLIWSIGNAVFFGIAININLQFLVPKFMFRQSIFSYLALLSGLALLLTPLVTLFNLWMVADSADLKERWLVLPQFHFINLLTITALSSLIRIPVDWLKIQAEKNELITKNIETELQSLKNQINPHFLFNTLNNLYALTLKKSDLAPEIVLKLSDMMRYMLYECNERTVMLEKEMSYILNYIELEKLRHSNQTEILLDIDPRINEYRIAPLLLIPFVENSFKHGLQSSLERSYIHIKAEMIVDELVFKVHNSKPENSPGLPRQNKQGGVGLVNVKKRLELMYPKSYKLTIEDMPDSHKVCLLIKLEKNHD